MNERIRDLVTRYPELKILEADMQRAFSMLRESYASGGKLLLCGNGGSAADADHWSGELLKGFASHRPLSDEERAVLPEEIGEKLQGALAAIPLSVFPALSSAFSNDVDPELTYSQLVWGLGKPGDVFVGISTSGNAKNVCSAMKVAKARGLICLALTGSNEGELVQLADHSLRVPAVETYKVQEYHLPVYHTLCLMLEDAFFTQKPE